jgi:hypothetical protein
VPRCIRVDAGTENVLIANIQKGFRLEHTDDMATTSVIIGRSCHNQVRCKTYYYVADHCISVAMPGSVIVAFADLVMKLLDRIDCLSVSILCGYMYNFTSKCTPKPSLVNIFILWVADINVFAMVFSFEQFEQQYY